MFLNEINISPTLKKLNYLKISYMIDDLKMQIFKVCDFIINNLKYIHFLK